MKRIIHRSYEPLSLTCDNGKVLDAICWLLLARGLIEFEGNFRNGRPVWIESEVAAWIESLPARQYNSTDTIGPGVDTRGDGG